jgi:NADH-quinone oxidoreductase subunit L
MCAGWLAISGFPLLAGFFSKDEILFKTFSTSVLPAPWPSILWMVGAVTALVTAIYMTRLMVLTFWGPERFEAAESHGAHDSHGHGPHGNPAESPKSMIVPLIVLALGAILAGYVGVPEGLSGGAISNHIEHFLEPSVASTEVVHAVGPFSGQRTPPAAHEADHSTEIALTVVSTIIALLGLGLGWFWFQKRPLWEPPRLLENKYYVDEVYDAGIVEPIRIGSTFLWRGIDIGVIDRLVNGAAVVVQGLGAAMRYMQSGLARSYVAFVVLGALLVIAYFLAYAIK